MQYLLRYLLRYGLLNRDIRQLLLYLTGFTDTGFAQAADCLDNGRSDVFDADIVFVKALLVNHTVKLIRQFQIYFYLKRAH